MHIHTQGGKTGRKCFVSKDGHYFSKIISQSEAKRVKKVCMFVLVIRV